MSASPGRPVSLALQGGGAHGAFTWGVLDRLLEDGRLSIEAITATSAGAMNAVALASGMEDGSIDAARERLETFWHAISRKGAPLAPSGGSQFGVPAFSPFAFFQALTTVASPYDLNPFDYNPLKDVLADQIDFAKVNAGALALFIAATDIQCGRAAIFKSGTLEIDHVLASACLPQVFKAVEIEGRPFWDGGYVANPALYPLFYADVPRDILIVHTNPLESDGVPKSAGEIQDRLNEITFNASLRAELRSIAFVQKLLDEGWLTQEARRKYRRMNIHAIRADKFLGELSVDSKFDTGWAFLTNLRDRGRDAAGVWLETCSDRVGQGSSIDIRAEFLENGDAFR